MVRHYKKDLIDLKKASIASIWKNWIVIAFILTFGFVNVNAEQRCCYSTSSQITSSSSNIYKLNVTASHVDSEKAGNEYFVAISFQQGYSVIGDPYSPFSKVTCSLTPGTIPQYNCHSKDSKTFFVVFDLSIQPPPSPNSTITASSVFIFSDKCQNVPFCTNLAEKHESEDSDKVSLGPLGTWPKYAVIIGGVILGISLLVACYLVYRRNRPDESYRDTSITPGTTYNDKNRIFAPNSLLRNGDDDDLPPPNGPPKNTLIQFGNVSARSPERSKSVKNTTLTSKPSTKTKREKNHHEIEIKSDDDKIPSVIIDMNGNNNLERSKSHKSKRSNNSKDNNNVNNRLSGYSTSELSKTISNNDISDRELSDNNNNEEIYSSNTKKYSTSSTSLHRSKSKIRNSVEESRRSSNNNHNNNNSHNNNSSSNSHNNNNNNHKPHRRSTSRGAEEDRDGHKIDRINSRRHRSNSRTRKNSSPPPPASRTLKSVEEDRDGHKIDRINSRRHRSHSRSRKSSSSPPPASKSTSDLQKSLSTRQVDRKKSFSNDRETGKNNNVSSRSSGKKSVKHNDLISNADTESTASSSDIPLGDKLPLAMLVTKMPSSGQLNSWKPDKVINEEDDDTTPLGRISSFGATSTSSQSRLPSTDKLTDDIIDYYDSILNEVLGVNDDDDDNPIRKSLKINKNKEKEKETVNDDEEIPIGQLRSG